MGGSVVVMNLKLGSQVVVLVLTILKLKCLQLLYFIQFETVGLSSITKSYFRR